MSLFPRQSFGPTCPSGGTWWACGTGTLFVGCCTRNPCTVTCPQGDLYQAAFNRAAHGTFPDASCGSGVSFWTCTAGNTFLGCCKSNPCSTGVCPRSDLEPAFLNREDLRVAYGATGSSSLTSASRPTTGTSTTRSSRTFTTTASTITESTATSVASAATAVAQAKDGPPVAAIAGGAAGGAFALAVIIGLLIYYVCHAKKSRKRHEETVVRRQSDLPAMMAVQQQDKDKGLHSPDAPPGYASPNPNDYYGQHAGQYQSYAHHQQQSTPELQELSIEPRSSTYFPPKPVVSHRRNMSELSGETVTRSELEDPLTTTPRSHDQWAMPLSSPHGRAQFSQHSPTSDAQLTWTPHQSWQTQPGSGASYNPQGLGVHGTSADSQQRGHQLSHEGRGYPNV